MSGVDLAGPLRAAILPFLSDRAIILRKTMVSDGAGGETESLLPVETVACRLEAEPTMPQERAEAGRTAAVTVWTAFLPLEAAVYPQDVLEVRGVRYEVVDSDREQTDGVVQAVNLRLAR